MDINLKVFTRLTRALGQLWGANSHPQEQGMCCIICSKQKRFSICWLLLLLELCSTGSEKDHDCVYLERYKHGSFSFNCENCAPRQHKHEQSGAGGKPNCRGSHPFTIISVPVSTVECPKALSVTQQLSIPHHFGGLEQI